MQAKPSGWETRPLSTRSLVLRGLLITGLLLGSLLPDIADINVSLIAGVIIAPVIAWDLIRYLPRVHPAPFFLLIIFGMFALHTAYIPPATDYGSDKFMKLVTFTLLSALAAVTIRDGRGLIVLGRVWIGFACVLALLTVVGYTGGRADTLDSNPIWLARALATATIITLYLWWQRRMRAFVAAPILILLGAGLIASGSRGPILGIIAAFTLLALFSGRSTIRRTLIIIVSAGVAIILVQLLPIFKESRFASLIQLGDTDQSRAIFWAITPPVIAAHPEGVGVGSWSLYANPPAQFFWPHNIFLEVLSEFGWFIGGVIIATLLAVLIALAVKASRKNTIALLMLALLGAETVQVSFSGDINARTFWFLLTLGFLVVVGTTKDAEHILDKRTRPASGAGFRTSRPTVLSSLQSKPATSPEEQLARYRLWQSGSQGKR